MHPPSSPPDGSLPTVRIPPPRYSSATQAPGPGSAPPPSPSHIAPGPYPQPSPFTDGGGYVASAPPPTAPFGGTVPHPVAPASPFVEAPFVSPPRAPKRSRAFGFIVAGVAIGIIAGAALGIGGISMLGAGGFSVAAEATPTASPTPTPTRPQSPIPEAVDACDLASSPYVRIGDRGDTLTLDTKGEESPGVSINDLACILRELDVPDSVISRISNTRALDGMQEGSWENFTATWNYHPRSGLSLIIEFVPEVD